MKKSLLTWLILLVLLTTISPSYSETHFGLSFYLPQLVLSGFNKIWYKEGSRTDLYTTGWFNWGVSGFLSVDNHNIEWNIGVPGIDFLSLEYSGPQEEEEDRKVDKYFWDLAGTYSYAFTSSDTFKLLLGLQYRHLNFNAKVYDDPVYRWQEVYNYFGPGITFNFIGDDPFSDNDDLISIMLQQDIGYMWDVGITGITKLTLSNRDNENLYLGDICFEYIYNKEFDYLRLYMLIGFTIP